MARTQHRETVRHNNFPDRPPLPIALSEALSRVPVASWLAVIVLADLLLALFVRASSLLGFDMRGGVNGWLWVPDVLMLVLFPVVICSALRFRRQQREERARVSESFGHVGTMMRTSREWLWAVDKTGTITFSSPMCEPLTGYTPAELIGSPMELVLDPSDLASALMAQPGQGADSSFAGLILVCRHRNGRRVLVDVTGRAVSGSDGSATGFEGMARAVEEFGPADKTAKELREKIAGVISRSEIIAAFQPIHSLATGKIVGAEALSRFPAAEGMTPEAWFLQATAVDLGTDLELLALRTALNAATLLPPDIFVAINLSPRACLDRRVLESISQGSINPSRLMIEVTERQEVTDYAELFDALEPLRNSGLRVAIDDAGAGFASMRHIIKLKPDLIKLDRTIIRDIDTDASHRALGVAMVGLSAELGATLLAEGIETGSELQVVTSLGIEMGQGYFLGHPSAEPVVWALWGEGIEVH